MTSCGSLPELPHPGWAMANEEGELWFWGSTLQQCSRGHGALLQGQVLSSLRFLSTGHKGQAVIGSLS